MPITSVRRALGGLLLCGVLASCGGEGTPVASSGGRADPRPDTTSSSEPAPSVSTTAPVATPTGHPGDPPNELGDVPVLMYHQVVPRPKGVYDITPRAFRAELERLAREGYVPVTAADYVAGRIDIPAGRHPVVLTFDDSTTSQLTLDAANRPVVGTAVAILLDVAADHPGFTPTATFYVNRDPFAEPGGRRTLGWLHDNGFEIGNHTLDHVSLGSLSPARVRRQLAGDAALIRRAAAGAPVTTLALPFGVRPSAGRNRRLMMAGAWGGQRYAFEGAFLVGAGPAPSPFSRSFDAAGIPRIRSQGRRGPEAAYGSARWLDRLAADPARRYTSDGDPDKVARPAGWAGRSVQGAQ